MKLWPFPLARNYPTNGALTDVFLAFAAAPDLVLHEPDAMRDIYYHKVSCSLGELRLWSGGEWYAWACRGTFTQQGFAPIEWDDEMPSRWAVKQMRERLEALSPRFRFAGALGTKASP